MFYLYCTLFQKECKGFFQKFVQEDKINKNKKLKETKGNISIEK
jgi:hypothetical protein